MTMEIKLEMTVYTNLKLDFIYSSWGAFSICKKY